MGISGISLFECKEVSEHIAAESGTISGLGIVGGSISGISLFECNEVSEHIAA